MSETFDPYFKWLGIPPEEQPPNHYRLLGLPLYVNDPDVIDNAADQRMGHIRNFQAGKHTQLSQKILNELSSARVCLLNIQTKMAYDTALKAKLDSLQVIDVEVIPEPDIIAPHRPMGVSPAPQVGMGTHVGMQPQYALNPSEAYAQPNIITAAPQGKSKWLLPLILGGSSIFGLLIIVAGLILFRTSAQSPIDISHNNSPAKETAGSTPIKGNETTSELGQAEPMVSAPFRLKLGPRGSIVVPNTESVVSFEQDFTVEAWCRWDPINQSKSVISAIGPGDAPKRGVGWTLRMTNHRSDDSTRVLLSYFSLRPNGSLDAVNLETTLKDSELAKWHHMAISKSKGYFSLYFNGNRLIHNKIGNYDKTTNARLAFGSLPIDCRMPSLDSTGGEIQAVRVSHGARYQDSLFAPPGEFKDDSSTLVLFDFSKPIYRHVNVSKGTANAELTGVSWLNQDGSEVAFSERPAPYKVGAKWTSKDPSFGDFVKTSTGWDFIRQGRIEKMVEIERTDSYVEFGSIQGSSRRMRIVGTRGFIHMVSDDQWRQLATGEWNSEATAAVSVMPDSTFAVRFRPGEFAELKSSQGLVSTEQPFTVELWLRIRPDKNHLIFFGDHVYGGRHPDLEQGRRAGFYVSTRSSPNTSAPLIMGFTSGKALPSAENEKWFHLAWVHDENQKSEFFANGRRAFRTRAPNWVGSFTNLYLGDVPHARMETTNTNNPYVDIAAFHISRSPLYTLEFTPPTRFESNASTQVLLDFSRPANTISDLSGNGHEAQITGARWVRISERNIGTN